MPTQFSLTPHSIPLISLLLFAVSTSLVTLAILALKASPRAAATRSLVAAWMSASIWVFGIAGLQMPTDNLRLWLAIAFSGASFVPATLLHLVRHCPVNTPTPSTPILLIAYIIAALLTYCAIATDLLFSRPRLVDGSLVRDAGALYSLFCVYFIMSWVLALAILAQKWALATARQRRQLRYFGTGVMLAGAGGATTNLLIPYLTGNSSFNWLGPCFVVPLVVLATHSIVRHHLMDLRLVVNPKFLHVSASLLSLSPLVAVILLMSQQRHATAVLDWWPISFLLTAGLLAPILRDVSSELLNRYFYRVVANYRKTVRESSALLTKVYNVPSLLVTIAQHITDAASAESVAIYAQDGQSLSRSVVLSKEGCHFETPDRLPPVFRHSLADAPGVFLEPYSRLLGGVEHRQALRIAMKQLNWSLVLPLLSKNELIGAIALGPKLSGDPYYPHDLDLLSTLANQAGIAVKNAQLYAEIVIANEYVENIVATINSGVVAINAAGRVTLFNRAAEQLTGLAADTVRLAPTSVLPMCIGQPLARVVADGRAVTYPEIALPGETTSRPVICTVSPLRDTSGSILGGVAVFSDLTPLKELEIERRRTEKLGYFKSLASGLVHEVKNPLVSIKTFVQLVPHRLDDHRWLEDFSRIVHREIERLERLLQRLVTLGRASERPQTLLDLRLPIREALELVQPEFAERRIRVTARLGEEDYTILGDHDEVKQLAHNLFVNALQHTPVEGGVIVELGQVDDRVVLTVTDTGPGIAPELLDCIFDPFVTTRRHGTGLGLAICAGIAAAHRAHLRARNHTAGGAIFTVEFPLVNRVPTTVSA
jgi:signal transduction histidine kinase